MKYTELLSFYRPLFKNLKGDTVSAEQAFQLQAMLIHDYRLILLSDPDFPDELLANGWVGFEVYELAKQLYKLLASASQHYIETRLSNAQGRMPEASPKFYKRFDGLEVRA